MKKVRKAKRCFRSSEMAFLSGRASSCWRRLWTECLHLSATFYLCAGDGFSVFFVQKRHLSWEKLFFLNYEDDFHLKLSEQTLCVSLFLNIRDDFWSVIDCQLYVNLWNGNLLSIGIFKQNGRHLVDFVSSCWGDDTLDDFLQFLDFSFLFSFFSFPVIMSVVTPTQPSNYQS